MAVAADHDVGLLGVDSSRGSRSQTLRLAQLVQEENPMPADLLGPPAREIHRERRDVAVAANRSHRRKRCELVEDALAANVAGVQNEVGPGKQIDQLPIEKTVRVGNDANLQRGTGHRDNIKAAAAPAIAVNSLGLPTWLRPGSRSPSPGERVAQRAPPSSSSLRRRAFRSSPSTPFRGWKRTRPPPSDQIESRGSV